MEKFVVLVPTSCPDGASRPGLPVCELSEPETRLSAARLVSHASGLSSVFFLPIYSSMFLLLIRSMRHDSSHVRRVHAGEPRSRK